MKTPPVLQLLTHRVRVGSAAVIRFRVSKISRVGITVVRNGQTLFLTSAEFGYGVHAFAIPALTHMGSYRFRLDATDLAGDYNQIAGAVQASR